MDTTQTVVVGIVAGVTIAAEIAGLILAVHNIVRYLYLQGRYKGGGSILVIFYVLAVLIFLLRTVQIFILLFGKGISN